MEIKAPDKASKGHCQRTGTGVLSADLAGMYVATKLYCHMMDGRQHHPPSPTHIIPWSCLFQHSY